jgi:Putative metallopeptidase domain
METYASRNGNFCFKSHPDNAEQKLTKARTQLLLNQWFFGTLCVRLKSVPGPVPTMATNGRVIVYNPEFVKGLTSDSSSSRSDDGGGGSGAPDKKSQSQAARGDPSQNDSKQGTPTSQIPTVSTIHQSIWDDGFRWISDCAGNFRVLSPCRKDRLREQQENNPKKNRN